MWTVGEDFALELVIDSFPPFSSMGVDYFYPMSSPGYVAGISEESSPQFIYHFDGDALEMLQDEHMFPAPTAEWGLRFSDFNNDGGTDLVYACGMVADRELSFEDSTL